MGILGCTLIQLIIFINLYGINFLKRFLLLIYLIKIFLLDIIYLFYFSVSFNIFALSSGIFLIYNCDINYVDPAYFTFGSFFFFKFPFIVTPLLKKVPAKKRTKNFIEIPYAS